MRLVKLMPAVFIGAAVSSVAAIAEVSYQLDIKPILDKKCVVCHACFDAPCQLVLTHAQGLERGANHQPVYDSLRVTPAPPTRLHFDAETVEQWRARKFFSVLPEDRGKAGNTKASILEQLLLMREAHDFEPNSRLPESVASGLKRKNTCPSPEELKGYSETFPHGGMPLGVSDLTDSERRKLRQWIAQGAPIEVPVTRLTAAEQQAITTWERLLNQQGLRERLVSRWVYEHLFMAHLYFADVSSQRFFHIVRSKTPSGKPIELIATRRPNDDPLTPFFYRLRRVEGTLVYKTHITFALNKDVLSRINTLFLGDDWNIEQLPAYGDDERSNPFQTFAAIPVKARYRFMLEHAEYFVQTFIRGPVCHGQVASDVIRDQFWVLFQDPERDLYVTSARYRNRATPYMAIAGVEQDFLDGARTWFSVKEHYDVYSEMRQSTYDHPDQAGASVADIWDGEGVNNNALLTVFRHHDNASVRRGLIGDYPLTVWWMDYPLFERGYYNLVVNFDVFGSVSHQAQTRLYFDLIRNDAERNFLRLVPKDMRPKLLDQWYEGTGQLKLMSSYQSVSETKQPSIKYVTNDPKRELLDRLIKSFVQVNARPDTINRWDQCSRVPAGISHIALQSHAAIRRIAAMQAKELPAVSFFPEVSFIRVFDSRGQREIYTVFRNRMHSNVAFMFGEDLRHKPEEDTLTLYPGILASYPNFIFSVAVDEIDDFVDTILAADAERDFEKGVVARWGVRRTHPRFWELFHDLTAYLYERTPIDAGVMDMSRYENL